MIGDGGGEPIEDAGNAKARRGLTAVAGMLVFLTAIGLAFRLHSPRCILAVPVQASDLFSLSSMKAMDLAVAARPPTGFSPIKPRTVHSALANLRRLTFRAAPPSPFAVGAWPFRPLSSMCRQWQANACTSAEGQSYPNGDDDNNGVRDS